MVCIHIDVYEAKTSPDSEVVPRLLLNPDIILISFRGQYYIITIVVIKNRPTGAGGGYTIILILVSK